MSKPNFRIIHDLSGLDVQATQAYLDQVSEFIGLPPELNGLSTILIDGKVCVYAKRGTAEVIRQLKDISIISVSNPVPVGTAIVFTATGKDVTGRVETATGAKDLLGLTGKALASGIMTASTRAIRRVTMQFTSLGILDESEVREFLDEASNPAEAAQLAGSPVVVPPPTSVNNEPGKLVEAVTEYHVPVGPGVPVTLPPHSGQVVRFIGDVPGSVSEHAAKIADKPAVIEATCNGVKVEGFVAVPAPAVPDNTPAKPKRTRKPRREVDLGVEPETVYTKKEAPAPGEQSPNPPLSVAAPLMCVTCTKPLSEHVLINSARVCPTPEAIYAANNPLSNHPKPAVVTTPVASPAAVVAAVLEQAKVAVPTQANSAVPAQVNPAGTPTPEQMAEYRSKISIYTRSLPQDLPLGQTVSMRVFITKMSGSAPQYMTVDQWEKLFAWFDQFVAKNQLTGLVKYVTDMVKGEQA